MFEGKNPVELGEAASQFATNVIDAIQVGIQNDKSKATANSNNAGADPLATRLINNGVARQAEILIDPCKSGREKYYIQTPYVISDSGLENLDDDGTGCCVGLPTVTACRYKLDLHELCVKDCVDTSLDEMLEDVVKHHSYDTQFPWKSVGDSMSTIRRKYVALYSRFIFERNTILGTPTYSGQGMRPFNGLISRLADDRVLQVDGSAGFIAAIEMLECRLSAMGMSAENYIITINPIAHKTLEQEVRTYLKTDPLTKWRLTGNGGVAYGRMTVVESRYVDVDLDTNTTSMWLINPSMVGIKMLYALNNPYIKTKDSEDDCGGHCITMHNAGSTVVTNWLGLVMVSNVHLDSICDSASLSGLENFVNSGVNGYLYPKAL